MRRLTVVACSRQSSYRCEAVEHPKCSSGIAFFAVRVTPKSGANFSPNLAAQGLSTLARSRGGVRPLFVAKGYGCCRIESALRDAIAVTADDFFAQKNGGPLR